MGSRYGGLKQMDELGPSGETIIDYSVYDAVKAGFGKVVFVIREDFEKEFREKVSNKYRSEIEVVHVYQAIDTPIEGIDYKTEREKPWGTGHAVLVTELVIDEPFAAINADDYYGIDSFQTMARFLENEVSEDHYGMMGYLLENTLSQHGTVSRGVCQSDDRGYLVDVVERTKIGREEGKVYYWDTGEPEPLDPRSPVSMNFWGFHPDVFRHIRRYFAEFAVNNKDNPKAEFYIPLYVNNLLQEGLMRMSVLETSDKWFGITYKEDKPIVMESFRKLHEEGKYPAKLW